MRFAKVLFLVIVLCLAVILTACQKKSTYTPPSSSDFSYSSFRSSSYSSSRSSTNYIDMLSFKDTTIKTGRGNDDIYVTVTNNGSVVLDGSIKAYIYYNGEIQNSAVLFLPSGGLAPGDSATISGIFNTVNGNYDKVDFEASTLREKSGSSYNSSSFSSSRSSTNYINMLSFKDTTIKTGSINDDIYVTVTNNGSVVLDGSIKAYIYYNGEIQNSAVLFLPSGGLAPGDSATISGIFNTVNGKHDKVKYESSGLEAK